MKRGAFVAIQKDGNRCSFWELRGLEKLNFSERVIGGI